MTIPKYERVLPSQISSLPPPSTLLHYQCSLYLWQTAGMCAIWACVFGICDRESERPTESLCVQAATCVCECVLEWVWRFSNTAITDKLIIQSYCRWCKTDEGTQGYTVSIFHYIREVIERNSVEQRAWWWLHQTNIPSEMWLKEHIKVTFHQNCLFFFHPDSVP